MLRGTRGLSDSYALPSKTGSSVSSFVDPVQPGGDHRAQRQVGVDVGAGQPVLDPQRLAVADDPQRAGAVVAAPGDRGRREGAGGEALVGVDVGRVEQRQLLACRRSGRR